MTVKPNQQTVRMIGDFGFEASEYPSTEKVETYVEGLGERISSGSGWGYRDIQIKFSTMFTGTERSEKIEQIRKDVGMSEGSKSYVSFSDEDENGLQVKFSDPEWVYEDYDYLVEEGLISEE